MSEQGSDSRDRRIRNKIRMVASEYLAAPADSARACELMHSPILNLEEAERLLARAENLQAQAGTLPRQLDAVDHAVGFPHPDGLGRIELIDAMKAQADTLAAQLAEQKMRYDALHDQRFAEARQRDVLAAQLAELKESNRTLAHQLERRANGMDALTQQLIVERDTLAARVRELEARIVWWETHCLATNE